MKKILFHINQLGVRGTEQAVYDYARYNETILGNESYIAVPEGSDISGKDRFEQRFPGRTYVYPTKSDLQAFADAITVDMVYWIKYGTNDGNELLNVRNVIHAVFDPTDIHGDRYASVSKWLGEKYNVPYVPHIVILPEISDNYREFLGIPEESIVIGRWGGSDSFDIPFVQHAVHDIAKNRPDIYFLFLNTDRFCEPLHNIIHIDPTSDSHEKRAFINTIDYALHGRERGETFGLSVCEALFCDKPVITCIDSPEKNHIEILGDRGLYYTNYLEVIAIIVNLQKKQYKYRDLVEQFLPEKVMPQFKQIFLD